MYGDVIRVKILFNKKDNALVQMSDPSQAQLVINYLDKINLFGNVLKISISKYSNVQMPKGDFFFFFDFLNWFNYHFF